MNEKELKSMQNRIGSAKYNIENAIHDYWDGFSPEALQKLKAIQIILGEILKDI